MSKNYGVKFGYFSLTGQAVFYVNGKRIRLGKTTLNKDKKYNLTKLTDDKETFDRIVHKELSNPKPKTKKALIMKVIDIHSKDFEKFLEYYNDKKHLHGTDRLEISQIQQWIKDNEINKINNLYTAFNKWLNDETTTVTRDRIKRTMTEETKKRLSKNLENYRLMRMGWEQYNKFMDEYERFGGFMDEQGLFKFMFSNSIDARTHKAQQCGVNMYNALVTNYNENMPYLQGNLYMEFPELKDYTKQLLKNLINSNPDKLLEIFDDNYGAIERWFTYYKRNLEDYSAIDMNTDIIKIIEELEKANKIPADQRKTIEIRARAKIKGILG